MGNFFRYAALFICVVLLISGCASTVIKQEASVINKANIPQKQDMRLDSDTVVVTAKRLTRLEKLKKEAAQKNNKDSVQVVSGTMAALAAYSASQVYLGPDKSWKGAVEELGVTAAAAYAAAIITGFIYDFFTKKSNL